MAALGGLFGLGGSAPPRNEVGSPYGPRIDLPLAPQTVNIAAGVAVGMITKKVAPEYPAVAKAARVQGTIVLQATISKTGTIQNLRVISGPPLLQQAALDAVQQWQYRPYLLMGQPVEVETTVNVIFSLGDSSVAAPRRRRRKLVSEPAAGIGARAGRTAGWLRGINQESRSDSRTPEIRGKPATRVVCSAQAGLHAQA